MLSAHNKKGDVKISKRQESRCRKRMGEIIYVPLVKIVENFEQNK